MTISAAGGYDTHSDQADDLDRNLRETCDGLLAFQRDLEARGLADRVLIEMWSEFGRRPEENGSRGTDHGAAGCAFVIGTQAKGEMVGEFPGLATLDATTTCASTSDFRGDVLLAARAVARPRRRPRSSPAPPASPGRPWSSREPRARAAAVARRRRLALALVARRRLGAGAAARRRRAAAADCVWQRHAKRS